MSTKRSVPPALIKVLIFFIVCVLLAAAGYLAVIFVEEAPWVMTLLWILWGFFGWRALTSITPSFFLILPVAGWLIFFFVKALLSVVVGAIVTPFKITKGIANALHL